MIANGHAHMQCRRTYTTEPQGLLRMNTENKNLSCTFFVVFRIKRYIFFINVGIVKLPTFGWWKLLLWTREYKRQRSRGD